MYARPERCCSALCVLFDTRKQKASCGCLAQCLTLLLILFLLTLALTPYKCELLPPVNPAGARLTGSELRQGAAPLLTYAEHGRKAQWCVSFSLSIVQPAFFWPSRRWYRHVQVCAKQVVEISLTRQTHMQLRTIVLMSRLQVRARQYYVRDYLTGPDADQNTETYVYLLSRSSVPSSL